MSYTQPRSHALDNLRTSLTALVVLHHAVVPYGGVGSWLYTSPNYTPASSISLVAFNVVNQSFFMGSFFLISAYFSSIAARRRTRKAFLWEKWKRLGVPTVVYSVIVRSCIRGIIAWRLHDADWTGVWKEFVEGVRSVRGVGGPVWYCALLLVFDAVYTVVLPSHFAPSASKHEPKKELPTNGRPGQPKTTSQPRKADHSGEASPFRTDYVLTAVTVTAITSFLIRTEYPVGKVLKPLCLQPAFISQYILYYIAGIHIHRSGRTLSDIISTRTLRYLAALSLGITTFGLFQGTSHIASGTPFPNIVAQAAGGVNVFALIYAFWNEFTGLFLSSAIIKLFTSYSVLEQKWQPLGIDVGKYSYAAFLAHTPILVDLQCAFGKSGLEKIGGAVGTAVVVGVLSVGGSWGVAWVVKRVVDWAVGGGYV